MMKYYSAKKGINSDIYHNMNQFRDMINKEKKSGTKCIVDLYEMYRIRKSMERESRLVVARV